MPAIRTGTRLESLQSLARRTEHELSSARRKDARREIPRLELLLDKLRDAIADEQGLARPRDVVSRGLFDLGLTAHDVRQWALEQGLIDQVRRGRLPLELLNAYRAAHRKH